MEGKHILLIDTKAVEGKVRHFSLRHMIVGMSRATHQKYVHFPTEKYERDLMQGARANSKVSMGEGGVDPSDYTGDDFDDIDDLALYFNDPDYDDSTNDLALYCDDFDEFHLIEAPVQLQLEDDEDSSSGLALYFNDPDDYPEAVNIPVAEFDEDGDVIM